MTLNTALAGVIEIILVDLAPLFLTVAAEGMLGKNGKITFEGREPSTLFREFAAECMELAQAASSPEKHALYMKMASVWFQMAQRWEKKS